MKRERIDMATSVTFNRIVLDTKRRWVTDELAEKLHKAVTQDYVDYMISDLLKEVNPMDPGAADKKEG